MVTKFSDYFHLDPINLVIIESHFPLLPKCTIECTLVGRKREHSVHYSTNVDSDMELKTVYSYSSLVFPK